MNNHPTICVCGAGTMGSGIAQVFAQKGFKVTLFDVKENMLGSAGSRIKKYAPEAMENVTLTSCINECRANVIVEAIIEDLQEKVALFNRLIEVNDNDTIFTTNTSSLSVSALAQKFSDPHRLAGMHFFNPAPLMRLVEIVKTETTPDEVTDYLSELVRRAGKTPVICKDSPGFIVNRVARPYYLEALQLLEKNAADIETIDKMMEATRFRMGPFKLMDLIGNDVNYSVSCIVHEALGKPARLKPSPIQEQKVKDGALGRKSGKGYYEYPVV